MLAASIMVAACEKPIDTSWHQDAGYRWRNLRVPHRGESGFDPLDAKHTGITLRNDVADEHALHNRNLLIGAGVAIGDVDGDGLPDVFIATLEHGAALYHNDGDFHFTDVTKSSGIDTRGLATLSAAFADVNGDGNLDLVVGTLGGPMKLWLGDGHGHFTDATATSGLVGGYAVTGLTFADVDGNGALDLYAATYKTHSVLDTVPPGARTFDQVVHKVDGRYEVLPQWAKEYRVEDRPELGGVMRSQRADPDMFFMNDGHGHFTHVPITGARWRDENGKPLAQEPDYFTLAARFYDVNGDGAPDLYVCNDFEDPDQFWINDGHGNFHLVSTLELPETSNTCMSVDFGDINRDGHVDIFTADMLAPTLAMRQRQIGTNTPIPKGVGLPSQRQQWMRNMLQLGRGDGTWAQIADYAGIEGTDWTWGSAFVDVDLDGYEDLLLVNGHRWDVRDADTFEKLKAEHIPWDREQGAFPPDTAHAVAFHNNHDLTFSNVSRDWNFGKDAAITNAIALGDLDGTGAMDVVTTRLDDAPLVYRNRTNAPRLAVRLKGLAPNTRGIGSVITVRAASLPVQSREITAGGYYLSGSDAELSFATGKDSLVTLEVRWRSGKLSTITARANRLYEVDETGAADVPRPAPDSASSLFENATALLHAQAHVDSIFDDYARQPLLPNKFSQLGPGVAWIESGNGRPDLAIGTGRGGRLAVLHNGGSGFSLTTEGPAARWDLTTLLPVPDGHGGTELLAGQSSYEASSAAEALSIPRVVSYPLRGGKAGAAANVLGPDSASVGPLALGDVNGDGRLDLFVGPRVIPGAWPLAAPSHIYLRQPDGSWTLDAANDPVLASAGLVSAALFTDIDGDGWPDLVLTAEWGPIRVYHNEHGRLRDVTKEWGLSGITSRWNGITAGDFDGDGRMDLVVTSWGRNTPWHASQDRPYELVVGNFGGAGLGLVFARRDSATGKEMPLESLERVSLAVSNARSRFTTFAAYSTATVDDLLGDAARSAFRVGATTFDNLVLLNRGNHFEVHSLPAAAQLAPAFSAVVADFDGDGHEDIFLAQNFSQTAMETEAFQSGAGLLLLGDGRGAFRPSSVHQSGIEVLGDQRGAAAADYDGDGRVDLAVSQNGAPTTLWHNRGARPGIRVTLDAGPWNPWGIGARLQLVSQGRRGPMRELHEGSGYWSVDSPITVLAAPNGADSIVVYWPGGRQQVVPLKPGQREVKINK